MIQLIWLVVTISILVEQALMWLAVGLVMIGFMVTEVMTFLVVGMVMM